MRFAAVFLLALVFPLPLHAAQAGTVAFPDGRISATVAADGEGVATYESRASASH